MNNLKIIFKVYLGSILCHFHNYYLRLLSLLGQMKSKLMILFDGITSTKSPCSYSFPPSESCAIGPEPPGFRAPKEVKVQLDRKLEFA